MTHRSTASTAALKAVLFDMDGTLVDTERLWWDAVEKIAAGLGRTLTEDDQPDVLGRPVEYTADVLSRATGAPFDVVAAELHREFAARVRSGVVPRPGAVALLSALRREGIPTALVTASPRQIADTVLDALGALGAGGFAVTVTADDTVDTKPSPDPYLAACRALRVPPAACVAVEDTPTGVASAEAAGCAVLAVPSVAPIAPAPGRTVLASLEQADVERLRSLVAAAGEPRLLVEELTTRRARVGEPFRASVAGLVRAAGVATFVKSGGPDWVRVCADGRISGTPTQSGPAQVTVTAVDERGGTTRLTVRIPVVAAHEPLVRELRVMSWNLWLGGTEVDDHRDKQLKVLIDANVDVVGLQETRSTSAQELADALGWDHHHAGENLGVISRYPIVAPLGDPDPGFYGATGARIRLDDHPEAPQDVVLWSAHLNYTPYGPYEARFDGLAEHELIAHETASGRLGQMHAVLDAMVADLAAADSTPVLLVGDFNVPSHRDWTRTAARCTATAAPSPGPSPRPPNRPGCATPTVRRTPTPYATPAPPGRRSTARTRTAAVARNPRTASTTSSTSATASPYATPPP